MTEQLISTLKAIYTQDSELFVMGEKGYVKLNIQEKTIQNDISDFRCLCCDNYWQGKITKVSVFYKGVIQKGRICVPCTVEVQDFQKQFPSMINVMKITVEKLKEKIDDVLKEAGKVGEKIRSEKPASSVKPVSRRNWQKQDLDALAKEAMESPQHNALAQVKKIVHNALSIQLPPYDPSNDEDIKRYKLTRRDGIVISNVAGKNLALLYPYMVNFFKQSNSRRFQIYLENGWNFSDRQAKQVHQAFNLLRKARILNRDQHGNVAIHEELK